MIKPFLRTGYNYNTDETSIETGLECKDPTLTQQQFLEESDINFIADRYGLTGELPQVLDLPAYHHYEGIFDFQDAKNAVRRGEEQFMTLPAKVRARFNNQPQQLLEFLAEDQNRDEAIKLGLVTPTPEPEQQTKPAPNPGDTPEPPKQ